jgi:phosphohistidine phosphatase
MKQLTLVRHAEARTCGMDFDRPLSLRGEQDAERMAQRLQTDGISADVILSSPAARAASTASTFAQHMGNAGSPIVWHDVLYDASRKDLMSLLSTLDAKYDHVVIVGHNPSITDIATLLQNDPVSYMPPCSVITIQFSAEHWSQLAPNTGTLLRYVTA